MTYLVHHGEAVSADIDARRPLSDDRPRRGRTARAAGGRAQRRAGRDLAQRQAAGAPDRRGVSAGVQPAGRLHDGARACSRPTRRTSSRTGSPARRERCCWSATCRTSRACCGACSAASARTWGFPRTAWWHWSRIRVATRRAGGKRGGSGRPPPAEVAVPCVTRAAYGVASGAFASQGSSRPA